MMSQTLYYIFDKVSQSYWIGGYGVNAEFASRNAQGAMPLGNCKDADQAKLFAEKIIKVDTDHLYFEKIEFHKRKGEEGVSFLEDVEFSLAKIS